MNQQSKTLFSNLSIVEMSVIAASGYAAYRNFQSRSMRNEAIASAAAAFLLFNKASGDAQFLGRNDAVSFDVKNFSFAELATIGLSVYAAHGTYSKTRDVVTASAAAVPAIMTLITAGKSAGADVITPSIA